MYTLLLVDDNPEPFAMCRSFARAFSLSPDFDASKIDASLKNGVLQLTIPRRDEARPRRIEVRTD